MGESVPDRRRYQRVQPKPVPWVVAQGAGRTATHRCTSLGLGGMFLECPDPLPVGSVVGVAFEIGGQTIRGLANVRRTAPRGMGLVFVSLKPEDRTKLGYLIAATSAHA